MKTKAKGRVKTREQRAMDLMQKAMKYAIYEESDCGYMRTPDVIGFNAKGRRLERRADRIIGWRDFPCY